MKSYKDYIAEALVKVGGQLGSNHGGQYRDEETGEKVYKKTYRNGDQAKVEALTGKIQDHMGIKGVSPEYSHEDGRHTITSSWNDHLEQKRPNFYKNDLDERQAKQLGVLYHAAILTKSWDAIGEVADNVLHHKKTGDIHSIDHGGTFHFRAQGGHKDYGPDIDEKKSLRDGSRLAGSIFNSAFEKHPSAEAHGLEAVKKMDMDHVHGLFKNSGLHNWEDLHKNFVARRNKLIS